MATASSLITRSNRRVLFVDDERTYLTSIEAAASGLDVDVATAESPEEGLLFVDKGNLDGVVCDWKMPGLSGRQLYECLLETHPDAAERMIFMTGDMLNETTERFLRDHDKTCLAKPFSLGEFQATVARRFQN